VTSVHPMQRPSKSPSLFDAGQKFSIDSSNPRLTPSFPPSPIPPLSLKSRSANLERAPPPNSTNILPLGAHPLLQHVFSETLLPFHPSFGSIYLPRDPVYFPPSFFSVREKCSSFRIVCHSLTRLSSLFYRVGVEFFSLRCSFPYPCYTILLFPGSDFEMEDVPFPLPEVVCSPTFAMECSGSAP